MTNEKPEFESMAELIKRLGLDRAREVVRAEISRLEAPVSPLVERVKKEETK